jgi:hypothetical protein
MRFLPVAVLVSLVSAVAGAGLACGSSTSSTQGAQSDDGGGAETSVTPTDAGSGGHEAEAEAEAAAFPAFVPTDFPQVANAGGHVMTAPKIYPVIFASDDATTPGQIEDFVSKLGATQYWKAAVSEYGVGAATGENPIVLTAADNPPATFDDSQIQAWLAGKLNANDPAFGTPDDNAIYALFYPAGVTITLGGGGPPPGDGGAGDAGGGFGGGAQTSCTAFGGYHDNIQLDAAHNTMNVAYAVIPRCSNLPGFTTIEATTSTASHEFAEAATDPYPSTDPAYATVDSNHRYWSRLLGGGEVGDMCAQNPGSFTTFSELNYVVQRIWSNATVKTGGDPCLPVPTTEVYFNAFPEMSDTFSVTTHGGTATYKGVKIAVGASKTIPIDLYSSAATANPWTVEALDSNQLISTTAAPLLKFKFDKASGQNGDKLNLTITVVTAGRSNTEPFLLVSKLGQTQLNLWAGVVGSM